jgi:hypothetical protein
MECVFRELVRVLRGTGSLYVFGDKDVVAEHWFRWIGGQESDRLKVRDAG